MGWHCKVLKTQLCGFAQFDFQCKLIKPANLLWLKEYERWQLDADATIGWAVAVCQWKQRVVGTHADRFNLVRWLYTFFLNWHLDNAFAVAKGIGVCLGRLGLLNKYCPFGPYNAWVQKKYFKDLCHGHIRNVAGRSSSTNVRVRRAWGKSVGNIWRQNWLLTWWS
jgi:hypothetical protein